MTVLLTVLKIIGIVLLILVGILLFLLLVILLAPIRYNSEGKYDDENRPLITARGSWICNIIRFYFSLKGKEKDYCLKVLWITVYPKREKASEDKDKDTGDKRADDKAEMTEDGSDTGKESGDEEVPNKETSDEGAFEDTIREEKATEADAETVSEDIKADEALERLKGRLSETDPDTGNKEEDKRPEKKSFFKTLKEGISNFRFKFKKFCDKISSGKLKIEDMVAKITDPRTGAAVRDLLFELKKLLYHMRPRKFRLYLKAGFEDPSLTGQLYGFYNSLYGIHIGKPEVVPDFEHKCLEGDYLIKGHLQLLFVLTALVRLYFNKDVMRLWGMIKK